MIITVDQFKRSVEAFENVFMNTFIETIELRDSGAKVDYSKFNKLVFAMNDANKVLLNAIGKTEEEVSFKLDA